MTKPLLMSGFRRNGAPATVLLNLGSFRIPLLKPGRPTKIGFASPKAGLDQTPNTQPLARNGYHRPPNWSHSGVKGLGHNKVILSRCSPDGRPRYRTVLKSRRLKHHVDS